MTGESGYPVERLDDDGLVEGFARGEVEGHIVMGRLLEKIDLGHRAEELLRRKDGSFLTDDENRPLRAVDYMTVADKHGATTILLGIVRMPETDPQFGAAKSAIAKLVEGYLPPIEGSGA